ncbi:carboxylesterase [Gallaecimonas sp. GXIMD4217]|uniref:alpha/beta hydrolase n=1 Tax=Gallaecimonas sp. GXIMD4217 TaxID=3131927 RepID=UPI00311AF749
MTHLPCLEIQTSDSPKAAVIWLHGLGADGNDFAPVVPELGLPDSLGVRFVFPHAPSIPVTVNGGYVMPAWYDILDLSLERKLDEAQLRASARAVQALIRREMDRGIASERIFLAGFSQGGAVAYEAALSFEAPLGGLLAMSSYFATADSVTVNDANRDLPVMIYHGRQDDIVPEQLGRQAVSRLQDLGYSPDYQGYDMAHSLCLEQIHHIGRWLQAGLRVSGRC